jgi:hypothetical protein
LFRETNFDFWRFRAVPEWFNFVVFSGRVRRERWKDLGVGSTLSEGGRRRFVAITIGGGRRKREGVSRLIGKREILIVFGRSLIVQR